MISVVKVILLLILVFSANALKSQHYNLSLNSQKEIIIQPGHFPDSSSAQTIEQVQQSKFTPYPNKVINYAYTSIPHWFKFSYSQALPKNNFYLTLDNSLMDEIEIYFINENKILKRYDLGDYSVYLNRPYNNPAFIVKLPASERERTDVYIKLKSQINLLAPLSIVSEERLFEKYTHLSFGEGIYYGSLLVIFFYSFFLYIRLKDNSYLFYILYLLMYGFSLFNFDGLFFKYCTPSSPYLNNLSLYFFIYLATIFGTLFAIKFLNLKQNWKLGYNIIVVSLSPIIIAAAGLFVYQNITLHDIISSVVTAWVSLIGIIVGLVVWKRGYVVAQYYFYAYTFMLLSVIIFVLKDLNFLPYNHFTKYVMHYGSFIEMVLLSLGLADRYNRLRIDNEKAQAKIIEGLKEIQNIQNKANAELEGKVEQRTAELNEQKNLLEIKNKEIIDSINYAKRIQAAIIPSEQEITRFFKSVFIFYKPKDIVAGDFYWMHENGRYMFFALADCTGHGVPGAMVSVICHNALNRAVMEFNLNEPGKILNKTREIVIEEFRKSNEDVKDGMDISFCAFEKSTDGKFTTLLWAGANNPVCIARADAFIFTEEMNSEYYQISNEKTGSLLTVIPHNQPIGKVDNPEDFYTKQVRLKKGDEIFLFTDGFQDQFGGPKSKKFKSANLKRLFTEIYGLSSEEQLHKMETAFYNWKLNNEQVDDVCVIGIKV